LDAQLLTRLRETSENEAIKVFSSNLHDLLLAAPAGQRVTMGLDPGLRTGVKVAVVDNTGKLVDTATIYPHPPRKRWQESIKKLAELVSQHQVELISIGNGTGSRETDKLVADFLKEYPELHLYKLVVSEAGASVYSASKVAASEFPDLDVSIRGAEELLSTGVRCCSRRLCECGGCRCKYGIGSFIKPGIGAKCRSSP